MTRRKKHNTKPAAAGSPVTKAMKATAARRAATPFDTLEPLDARHPGVSKALAGSVLGDLPQYRPVRRIAEAYLTASLKHSRPKDVKAAADKAIRTSDRPAAYNQEAWIEGIALAHEAYNDAVQTT